MECLEEGELPSSPDEPLHNQESGVPPQPVYTPLPRPQVTSSSKTRYDETSESFSRREIINETNNTSSSTKHMNSERMVAASTCQISSSGSDSSTEDSDSDSQCNKGVSRVRSRGKKFRRYGMQEVRKQISDKPNDGGEDFQNAVKAYHHSLHKNEIQSPSCDREKRKNTAKNNVWGSILKEDALTSDLTSIAVGRKSVKDLNSDRGAEAYDYSVAAEFHAASRQDQEEQKKKEKENKLDDELGDYWKKGPVYDDSEEHSVSKADRRDDAICAGKKRSAKDRLGTKKSSFKHNRFTDKNDGNYQDSSSLEDMSIPQPGMPRTIPDLSSNVVNLLLETETMEEEQGIDNLQNVDVEFLGEELAARLCEPKTELMVGVIDLVGGQVVLELFQKTQKIESEGGMMIKNGARRRTPGGVFLHLLREINNDPRVDPKEVKQFFAQSQKNDGSQAQRNFSRNHPQQQKVKGPQRESNNHPYKKNYKPYQRRSHNKNSSKKEDSFENELEALRKLSQKVKDKKQSPLVEQPIDMEDDDRQDITDESLKMREVKPLPDILACISKEATPLAIEKNDPTSSKSISQHDLLESCNSSTAIISGAMRSNLRNVTSQLDNFEEPEAPPNSVERVDRTISTYEDDLGDCSTEDIELF